MRIHTYLDSADFYAAARAAGVSFTRFDEYGSRSHTHAFDVILSGSSGRRQNGGMDEAATWDEWGVFLSVIFNKDADAKCWAYADLADFNYKTATRFAEPGVFPADTHKNHKFMGDRCTQCSAVRKWV